MGIEGDQGGFQISSDERATPALTIRNGRGEIIHVHQERGPIHVVYDRNGNPISYSTDLPNMAEVEQMGGTVATGQDASEPRFAAAVLRFIKKIGG